MSNRASGFDWKARGLSPGRARFRLGLHGAVVDNNGTHSVVEKSGAVYLDAGHHPIRLEWFNGSDKSGLEVAPGVDGQIPFVIELPKIVKNLPGNMGAGIVWWGAEYQSVSGVSLAGFDTRSCFDRQGNALPVAGALGQLTAPVQLTAGVTDDALTLRWPFSAAGMVLMTATNLTPFPVWQPVSAAIEHRLGLQCLVDAAHQPQPILSPGVALSPASLASGQHEDAIEAR